MPNWCYNGLVLKHKDPAMIDRVVANANSGLLNEFIPCPQELVDTVAGSFSDEEQQRQLDAQQAANVKKYGYPTWYEWSIANWGTKWDVNADTVERIDANSARLSFESAWSPPIDAYARLEAMGFEVQGFYYEPGMCFCGIYEDGVDDCIEYGHATSATVREVVGERLDDYFGISEEMAQYDEEEAE